MDLLNRCFSYRCLERVCVIDRLHGVTEWGSITTLLKVLEYFGPDEDDEDAEPFWVEESDFLSEAVALD